jgi:hypothetical protein
VVDTKENLQMVRDSDEAREVIAIVTYGEEKRDTSQVTYTIE